MLESELAKKIENYDNNYNDNIKTSNQEAFAPPRIKNRYN